MEVMDLSGVKSYMESTYQKKTGSAIPLSKVIITFEDTLEGETWTVTDGDAETHTGVVGNDLTAACELEQYGVEYTITCSIYEEIVKTDSFCAALYTVTLE